MKKSISFDIDGVLNRYPETFIKFCQNLTLKKVNSFQTLKESLTNQEYRLFKHKYRLSQYKFNLKINPEIKKIINILSKKYCIYIFSSRKFYKYPTTFAKTNQWLKKNGILYEKLMIKNYESFLKKKIIYHIDDDINHICNTKTTKNLKIIILGNNKKTTKIKKNIIFCKNEIDLLKKII